MHNDFIVAMAEGLAAAGFATLRFNFPYAEKGRRAPDSPKKLNAAWKAAVDFVRSLDDLGVGRLICAGKSMGGRIASQLIAAGELEADGLLLFGYPLHPAGRQEQLRDAHLYGLAVPMLLVEGTRDPLCNLSLLEGVLAKVQTPWSLEVIEGGDHSFRVLKALGRDRETVHADILERSVRWLRGLGT